MKKTLTQAAAIVGVGSMLGALFAGSAFALFLATIFAFIVEYVFIRVQRGMIREARQLAAAHDVSAAEHQEMYFSQFRQQLLVMKRLNPVEYRNVLEEYLEAFTDDPWLRRFTDHAQRELENLSPEEV